MTIPISRDRIMLSDAAEALEEAVKESGSEATPDVRLRLLEGVAAEVGRYDLELFDRAMAGSYKHNVLSAESTTKLVAHLVQAVMDSPISPSLALAVLGDSELGQIERRRKGRYFTDSRLALNLTGCIRERAKKAANILDPACGAGALLVAAALQVGSNTDRRTYLVRRVLWGVDRDPRAVRAARAAISSLTCDIGAIAALRKHLFVADSLTVGQKWWRSQASSGFDLVVGNPPWEKLKISKHEFLLSKGLQRHYGQDYNGQEFDEEVLKRERLAAIEYRDLALSELTYQGKGEADLYKLFIELGAKLVSKSGALAFLAPAGLIRNNGTRELREWMFQNFDVDILILDNRERYFEIDSRFKFLQLLAIRRKGRKRSIQFGSAPFEKEHSRWKAKTSLAELRRMQPGLTIPEVRTHSDWELFSRIRRAHSGFGNEESGWQPRFFREVDMTNDRQRFRDSANDSSDLSLIEGRMVHHHRVSAKRYIGGRGRRAEWKTQFPLGAPLKPQWQIAITDLRTEIEERVSRVRAGFCDITGQTNERTVLAALIPHGVVCGNKVPTVDFAPGVSPSAWVGIANSFVFDWLARRCISTTINFFILLSLPIPAWNPENEDFLTIARWSQILWRLEREGGLEGRDWDLWDVACIRAGIEVSSARLYGISVADLDQMLRDFPQVDREQIPLPGEKESTISRDLIVASGEGWASPSAMEKAKERSLQARELGAIPFIPNQHARAYRKKS